MATQKLAKADIQEEFDGQVRHRPPGTGGFGWVDEWWGPGGHLVITQMFVPSVDCEEVLTTPDGEVIINHVAKEGGNYELLPQLFGPELWKQREENRLARIGG